MLDKLVTLSLMFLGAYGAACVPFSLDVQESQVSMLTSLGGGMMLSCVLAVIIPEGFHSWFGEHGDAHDHTETDDGQLPFILTGVVMILGFLAMVFLDQVQGHSGKGGGACCGHTHTNQKKGEEEVIVSDEEEKTNHPEAAIAGLMVHCMADGLAMGSAFLSGSASMNFVLGTAMVLHKAPMAFGLSSYLISCKWNWKKSQETILWFSAMAPLATVMTYVVFHFIPIFGGDQGVALAILFSGGTFLHAATNHILPGVIQKRMATNDILSLILGSALPVIFSLGHHH